DSRESESTPPNAPSSPDIDALLQNLPASIPDLALPSAAEEPAPRAAEAIDQPKPAPPAAPDGTLPTKPEEPIAAKPTDRPDASTAAISRPSASQPAAAPQPDLIARAAKPPTHPRDAARSSSAADLAIWRTATGELRLGAQADKESDASSIVTVPRDQWRLGKPLAGRGIELKPRRPEFTDLMRITSAP